MNGNITLSFFHKVKCDEADHCGPFRMLSLSPFATVAVAILFFLFCSISFAEEGSLNSFTQTSEHNGKDYVALSKDPLTSSNVFRRLIGSYNGTTFTIPIDRDDLPGMAYYPEGLHYGKSSRYVWITSYYRYYSGITLVDLTTSKSIFAAYGRGPQLSPDSKRVAYFVDGVYGPLYAVCVNDFVVFPRVQQSTEMISRGNDDVRAAFQETPQMDPESGFKWLNNSDFCFTYSEYSRAAALEKNPAIQKTYFVKISGVGENATTDTIKIERAKLSISQAKNVADFNEWDALDLVSKTKDKMTAVSETSWAPDIFNHPDWPILPLKESSQSKWASPGGNHVIKAAEQGVWTDMDSGVVISLNDQIVIGVAENEIRLDQPPERKYIQIGPTSRLLSEPKWINGTSAQVIMQSNWVTEALLGEVSSTKFWLVTLSVDEKTSASSASKHKVSRQQAQKLINESR